MAERDAGSRVILVAGEDAALVDQELAGVLQDLQRTADRGEGDEARSSSLLGGSPALLLVEEYGSSGGGEPASLGPVLDACSTMSLLGGRRVVVLRGAEQLDASQVTELAAALPFVAETTDLVIVVAGKRPAAALARAVAARGEVRQVSPGSGRGRERWIAEHLGDDLRFDRAALARLASHLGEDLARLAPLAELLTATFGPGARIGLAELEPFLGTAGAVPPWDLTDGIDQGELAASLSALHRMLGPGECHPFQVLTLLFHHFEAILRLDGTEVTGEADAAALLGTRPYPARKALSQSRRLGSDRSARAIALLAAADLALRGETGWPPATVLEVLVARLAQLSRSRGRFPGRPRR
jgi:DNA polymerase-3 subunit delta